MSCPTKLSVHEIAEILGERCCELPKMSHKKRKNGLGAAAQQQFLVHGEFLVGGDNDSDSEVLLQSMMQLQHTAQVCASSSQLHLHNFRLHHLVGCACARLSVCPWTVPLCALWWTSVMAVSKLWIDSCCM